MTYILSLGTPVRYEADDDDHARVIAEHIEDTVLAAALPHAAAYQDDAPGYALLNSTPGQPLRVVVAPDDAVARYAPFPADTGAGHEPCPECLDYIAASRSPAAGDVGISVETVDPEVDQPGQWPHDALARWFTDGWRAQCVCGYLGQWHTRAEPANADAVSHNRTAPESDQPGQVRHP